MDAPAGNLGIPNCLRRWGRMPVFICLAVFLGSCGIHRTGEQLTRAPIPEKMEAKMMTKDTQPSAEALARKEKSLAKLLKKGVPAHQHLPVIEDSKSAQKRTKEAIAHRAIALCLVALKGEGLDQPTVQQLVRQYGAHEFFTTAEKEFIAAPSSTQHQRIQFAWQYEDYWVMLWALGYVATLDYPDKICDVPRAVNFLRGHSVAEFIAKAKLRDLSEILDEADLIYRLDWATVNARIKKQAAPAGLDAGVVLERHRALNWLIGYMNQEWDNVSTDT